MNLFGFLNFLILILCKNTCAQSSSFPCNNYYASKTPRAMSEWQTNGVFNATDPKGLMEFDEWSCLYVVVLRNLQPNRAYTWRVALNNVTGATGENLGCTTGSYIAGQGYLGVQNAFDCLFTTNSNGEFRLYIRMQFAEPRLDNDLVVNQCANKPCNGICDSNPFTFKDVRVTGTWPFDLGRINFDTCSDLRCIYAKSVTGLMSNTDYDWKVTIDGSYLDKYNFNGTLMTGQNCKAKTDLNGNVRIINI